MLHTIATPTLWAVTIAAVVVLIALDFLLTRRPHEVSMKEALGWSAFYIALPLAFGVWVWSAHGSQTGFEYYTGYIVEKSLSVDNLFVFMLLLAAFAVPRHLQQKVLLFGIVGALVLRGIFIALGAAALSRWDVVFLIFGAILLATAVKLFVEALQGHDQEVDPEEMLAVRLGRKIGLKPMAIVVLAIFATDIIFAVDSVPAVYGITGDPYLVFATNAFALLGLRALYFVLEGALSKLVHLSYGLAAILAFIGVKLGLHWAHGHWAGVPVVPTWLSLVIIVGILAVTVTTSLIASSRSEREEVLESSDA
ncbi:putative tellurium resistance membrane protein TerC [Nocardioides luteus]|uniref:Tellurium resistance protein TerC n=1 Tax=Nocardioides luteus TaxID=1844 RepID=A0ABQ5SSS4_9ACTN|nr:TerC family protein [Nocardioides luteus]MDR7311341.1 putative tellurium resistance membrane protein TerC [Nocardioides luteus]GGR71117.1 tellurium resistance protein TerC [Nocardioides luteus]GLJ66846.1 tellurium resistance protein TerC [Nocardioides luteus]